jgi:hypothetical protein
VSDPLLGVGRDLRILDFDIENRPLTYWVPDMPTADITAIAWMWVGDHDTLTVRALGEVSQRTILEDFVEAYSQADIVTGHYIRRHDLPIINGALYEHDLPLLTPKMTSDTKLDMFKKADLPATQEFLLELLDPKCPLGITLEKYHMSQGMWREANRLTTDGIAETKRRVMSDVHAHSHMREAMLQRGWLRRPSVWYPGGGVSEVSIGRVQSGESK